MSESAAYCDRKLHANCDCVGGCEHPAARSDDHSDGICCEWAGLSECDGSCTRSTSTHDRAPLVSPGSKCPTCERRIPHPKKDTSPQTKVVSIRVPIDDAETFKEMLEAAASHLGLLEKPHSNYWTVLHGLVLILQGHGEEG